MVLYLIAAFQSGHPALVNDIEPVFAAGIHDIQLDIGMSSQFAQYPDIGRRDGRLAEKMQAFRQQAEDFLIAGDEHGQKGCYRAAFVRTGLADDTRPQVGLPCLIRLRGGFLRADVGHLAFRPALKPLRTVNAIAVEQGGDPAGQFEAHGVVAAVEIGRQPRMGADERVIAEHSQNPP